MVLIPQNKIGFDRRSLTSHDATNPPAPITHTFTLGMNKTVWVKSRIPLKNVIPTC